MNKGQVYKALTVAERIKLKAMQKQQGLQWRGVVRWWWEDPRRSYYGTETDPELMDKLCKLCEGNADKIPLL